jgi:hypothetical protein
MNAASPIRRFACAAGLVALSLAALPAVAQPEVEPWRSPSPAVPEKPKATSDISATAQTATTPAQQREAKALSTAVFAKPAAKAKAAQKIDDANQADLSAVQPKAEWAEDKSGVGVGGKGVQIKAPF